MAASSRMSLFHSAIGGIGLIRHTVRHASLPRVAVARLHIPTPAVLPRSKTTLLAHVERPSLRHASTTNRVTTAIKRFKSQAKVGLYATAGVSLVVGAGYAVYKTSSFMASLNFTHVTSFGFYLGGIASGGIVLASAAMFRRLRGVHPESVFKEAMTQIARSPTVSKHLGKGINAGTFKAYSHRGEEYNSSLVDAQTPLYLGGAILDKTKTLPTIKYEPYGLQLLFQVAGNESGGIVSVDALSTGAGRFKLASLALDMQDGTRYVLVGNPEEVVYQGIMKLR